MHSQNEDVLSFLFNKPWIFFLGYCVATYLILANQGLGIFLIQLYDWCLRHPLMVLVIVLIVLVLWLHRPKDSDSKWQYKLWIFCLGMLTATFVLLTFPPLASTMFRVYTWSVENLVYSGLIVAFILLLYLWLTRPKAGGAAAAHH